MKKIIFGILVGLLLGVTGTTFATQYIAEDANFPVLVNGKAFTTDKPIVTINGSTYMPLRAVGEALGVKVSWNSNLSRVEIGETEMSSVKSNDEKDYSNWVLFETDNYDFVRDGILKGEIIYYEENYYLISPEYYNTVIEPALDKLKTAASEGANTNGSSHILTPDAEYEIVDN